MSESKDKDSIKKPLKIFRIFMYALLFLLLAPLLLSLLLQIKSVQNFAVDQSTSYLGKKFGGEIIVDEVDFSMRYGLDLNGFTLIDENQDTIIQSEKFVVALQSNILSLIDNVLDINSVHLVKPKVRINRPIGSKKSNLEIVLDKLLRKNRIDDPEGDPIDFDIKDIKLTGLDLLISDAEKGSQNIFLVDEGHIKIDKFLENDELVISLLRLKNPVIKLLRGKNNADYLTMDEPTENVLDSVQREQDLDINIDVIDITGGEFILSDGNKPRSSIIQSVDYNHLHLSEIEIDAGQFLMEDMDDIIVDMHNITFKDSKGFHLKELKSNNIHISSEEIDIPELYLKTDHSILRDRLRFSYNSYADFKNFENEVEMLASFEKSRLYVDDLLHFVPALRSSEVFSSNINSTLSIDGYFQGEVNRLMGKNIFLKLDDVFYIAGNFSSHNLSLPGYERLSVEIDSLSSDMQSLKRIVPDFNPPDNFMKIGNFNFKGDFKGLLRDFSAKGDLHTDIGSAKINMDLNASHDVDEALYAGDIAVTNFDLGRWSSNQSFGKLSMSASVKNGVGLTAKSAKVDLSATLNSIEYKGYTYRDVMLDGKIDKTLFDGELSIDNPEVSFYFDGTVELNDKIPYLAFDANIKKLDLYHLNLVNKPLDIKGNFVVDIEGKSIDDVSGSIVADSVNLYMNDTIYQIDHLYTYIDQQDENKKELKLMSELFDISALGTFQLTSIIPSSKKLLIEDYPVFLKHWSKDFDNISYQNFELVAKVIDSRNLLELAGIENLRFKDVEVAGRLNTDESNLNIDGIIPQIQIGNNEFFDSRFSIINVDKQGSLHLIIDSSSIDGWELSPIHIASDVKDKDLTFRLNAQNVIDSVEQVSLIFNLKPSADDGYMVSFDNDKLVLLGKEWNFHPLNSLEFNKEKIVAENIILSDGKRSIIIDDINDSKGVNLKMEDFDLALINPLLNIKKIDFSGESSMNLSISDVFSDSYNLFGGVTVPDLRLNDDRYGRLNLKFVKPKNDNIDLNFSVASEEFTVNLLADVNPKTKFVEASIQGRNFPLKLLEEIIVDGIRDTYGGVDINATITGPLNGMRIFGEGKVLKGGTRLIYTGVPYHFENQDFTITEKRIDLTGAEIYDENENSGIITGGLNHDYFRDFEVDVNISGEDVIALQTTKDQNPLYYGYARGAIDVDFNGPFHLVNMKIVCETKKGTVLNIPIETTSSDIQESFITFIDTEELFKTDSLVQQDFRLEGINIEMDISMTPDAQVNLIFDESKGDVIEGRGRGDLKVYITRYGDFDIYGNYTITSGEYLFTAFGLVAKPFQVEPGGLIRWTGDPVNATLDIKANYNVRTPLDIFLSEYLSNPQIADAASNKTDVDLQLHLKNKLFNPTVNFDLEFPELTGGLRSVVDSKMRTLENNQNEINNQVLGLLVFNSFLPSSSLKSVAGTDVTSAGISTLSEFVSSQLSIMFTGLINEALTEDGLVSGIDFNIGLKKNSFYGVTSSTNDILPDEIEVHLKNKFRFLDERLSLNVGGNYVRAPIRNIQEYFIGDFVLEYYLTEDRKLKLRMYGKYDYDEAVADRKLRYGLGLGYRNEFGSLTDFQDNFKEDLKEIIEEDN